MNSDLIFALCVAFTKGIVLSANNVTAGNGSVVDWRTVKSGDHVLEDANAYDVAIVFVNLAGWGAVAAALDEKVAA
jgi:hypothetical protein